MGTEWAKGMRDIRKPHRVYPTKGMIARRDKDLPTSPPPKTVLFVHTLQYSSDQCPVMYQDYSAKKENATHFSVSTSEQTSVSSPSFKILQSPH